MGVRAGALEAGPDFEASFCLSLGFPGGSDGKEFACNMADPSLIPGSGRCPGEGNSSPPQYSCLEKSMDRGSWWATSPWDHKGSDTTEWLTHFCLSLMQKWSEVKWSESHSVVSDSLQPHGLYSPWNSSGQNTGVGSLSLFQGIFPTQGLNPGLPHCRRILYQLSHQGSLDGHMGCFKFSDLLIVGCVY